MLELDGSRYSGSGTIVRQAVAFAALTGKSIHVRNARARRLKPGLRAQHLRVVEAIQQLVRGEMEGVGLGSQEFVFRPGTMDASQHYTWDIGSAGSTTLLALAILPILAFRPSPVTVDIIGGLFQDFAPSIYHLQHVILPLLDKMGLHADVVMRRPGYVPRGGGMLCMNVQPLHDGLQSLILDKPLNIEKLWGISLASHLEERKVAHRMAEAAREVLAKAGYQANLKTQYESTALQPGAALALFADLTGALRLGADMAGAPGRRAEVIGKRVAKRILEEIEAKVTLDRYAADQIIPFAVLAVGHSRFRIAAATGHVDSNAWLAKEFLGAEVAVRDNMLSVSGISFHRGST